MPSPKEIDAGETGAPRPTVAQRRRHAAATNGASAPPATPEEKAKDLDNPDTQKQILAPTIIVFRYGERFITIPTEFSLTDIHRKHVYRHLQAFTMLFAQEVAVKMGGERMNPAQLLDPKNEMYHKAALAEPAVRAKAVQILSLISFYSDKDGEPPRDEEGKPKREMATMETLDAMDDVAYQLATAHLLSHYAREVKDSQKNSTTRVEAVV